MLAPLEQFLCDTCHQVIDAPDQGWFEWLADGGRAHSLRIVHQQAECRSSPDKPGLDGHKLDELVGAHNLARLYTFISVQPDTGAAVASLDEFTEILHRLTMRYYEEARLYIEVARGNGFFISMSEPQIYQPSTFKQIIQAYGDEGTTASSCGCGCH